MTAAGVVFLVLGVVLALIFQKKAFPRQRNLSIYIFFYHLFFCLLYWYFSLSNPADARMYYRTATGGDAAFGFGSQFVIWFTQCVFQFSGGSYLDLFLFYHVLGYIGLAILCRTLFELMPVTPRLPKRLKYRLMCLIFLPGLHFWTSAIGKDSITFLGSTLVLWSLMNISKRVWFTLLGFVLLLLVRPHVALMSLIALIAASFGRLKISVFWKIVIFVAFVSALCFIFPYVMNYVGLDEVSSEGFGEYVSSRQSYNLGGGSSLDISQYSYPIMILTYLYRPLFFDASGVFGLVVSVENLILLSATLAIFSGRMCKNIKIAYQVFALRYGFFFLALGVLMSAPMTANLGIAIRQKTMFLPGLIVWIVALYYLRYQRTQKMRLVKFTQMKNNQAS